jgi:hypothetical protein
MWTVNRLAMQNVGTSISCPRRSVLATDAQISTTKVWPSHSQPCGQPAWRLSHFSWKKSTTSSVVYLHDQLLCLLNCNNYHESIYVFKNVLSYYYSMNSSVD